MKGGYQIIDLRKLNLELSSETGSITDVEILDQLRSLRVYIEKGHNYTKPLDKALKCVIVRYRDGKNGEKLEACQWANIECSNESLTYEIKTKGLMIEVVFEEKTDEYENKYYDIKTAKYLYNHNEIVEGDLIVGGNLQVESINDEDNPSVKPIYVHPIVMVDNAANIRNVNIALFIFNNDETPFTTWEQVRNYIISIVDNINDTARFLTTGAFIVNDETYIACHIYCQKVDDTTYSLRVEGSKTDGSGAIGYLSIYSSALNVYDGVNKIN